MTLEAPPREPALVNKAGMTERSFRLRPIWRRPSIRGLSLFLATAVAYGLLSWSSFAFFGAVTIGVTFFPPAGLTVAALALVRSRHWPVVVAAALVAEVVVDVTQGQGAEVLGYALANVAEPVVGVTLLRYLAGDSIRLFERRWAASFLAGPLIAGPIVGAAIGAATIRIQLDGSFWSTLGHWYVGDALGVLVIAPVILTIVAGRPLRSPTPPWVMVPFAIATIALAVSFAFTEEALVGYVGIAVLAWAGVTQGPLGVAFASAALAIGSTAATARGLGPWIEGPASDPHARLLQQQSFLFLAVLGAWLLVIEVAERTRAYRERDTLAGLQALTSALAAATTTDEAIDAITTQCALTLGAREVFVAVAPGDETTPFRQPNFDGQITLDGMAVDLPVDVDVGTVLPLEADGVILGALGFVWDAEKQPRGDQRDELALVAAVASQGIARGRRLDAERAARVQAEALQSALEALGRAATRADIATAVMDQAVPALGAVSAMLVARVDDQVELLGSFGYDGAPSNPARLFERGTSSPAAAALYGGSIVQCTVDDIRDRFGDDADILLGAGGQAWMGLPLTSHGAVAGALGLGFADDQPLRDDLRIRVTGFAAVLGDALERAGRFESNQRVANHLQSAMLERTPSPIGLDVACMYQPAVVGLQVGGDWYDVVELGEDRFALVIGDVVGRGLGAASAMAQLRSAVRALAFAHPPAELMTCLDQYARQESGCEFATVAYVVYDARRHELTYAVAGHPAPMLANEQRVDRLDQTHGPPLGVDCARSERTIRLGGAPLLVLYTDGLIERRGESIDVGLDELSVAVARAAGLEVARSVCTALTAEVRAAPLTRDDVAVLCARLRPVPVK